ERVRNDALPVPRPRDVRASRGGTAHRHYIAARTRDARRLLPGGDRGGAVIPTERIVVGAVITKGGRVLAARRTYPAGLAGYWEFPGGKVEADERPDAALKREI